MMTISKCPGAIMVMKTGHSLCTLTATAPDSRHHYCDPILQRRKMSHRVVKEPAPITKPRDTGFRDCLGHSPTTVINAMSTSKVSIYLRNFPLFCFFSFLDDDSPNHKILLKLSKQSRGNGQEDTRVQ